MHRLESIGSASTMPTSSTQQTLILIDNYDSFTYTIKNYIETLQVETIVIKNDDAQLMNLEALDPTHILLSPGPGNPDEAGFTLDVIKKYHAVYPFLGVCLGHQCLIQAFGGKIIHANEIMHGKVSVMSHSGAGLFNGISQPFKIARYHSLVADKETMPDELFITGWTYDQTGQETIMAFQHKKMPIFGVQYHPEAILTEHGHTVFKNFLTFTPA